MDHCSTGLHQDPTISRVVPEGLFAVEAEASTLGMDLVRVHANALPGL